MSMTESARGYTRQPAAPRPSYAPSPESRTFAEHSSYTMRLPHPPSLPPMSSLLRDEQPPSYNQYYQPGSSHSLFNPNHPLQLSQQDPSAPLQHIYRPSQVSEHEMRVSSYPPNTHPSPIYEKRQTPPLLDRMGSRTQENYGAPLAQRRQTRKISQRKPDASEEKTFMSASSASAASPAQLESLATLPATLNASPKLGAAPQIPPLAEESPRLSRPVPISRLLSDGHA